MKELEIGQIKIPYEIVWSEKRSSIGLSIDDSMELTVRAPTDTSLEEIKEVLDQKRPWVLEKVNKLEEQKSPPLDKEFLSGEKLQYKGRRYRLKVHTDQEISEPELIFRNGKFHLFTPKYKEESHRSEEIEKTVIKWFKSKAEEELASRVDRYASEVGVKPEGVIISDMSKNWGEYKEEKIKLHWKLLLAPIRIQDYVIVHELTHFKHNNHTENFWHTIGSILPDYEKRIEWLRKNGKTLKV